MPCAELMPKSKRWWTKELTQLQKAVNKLGRQVYKRRADPDHVIHAEHKEAAKRYDQELNHTKKQHWQDWLERVDDPDIWAAHKMILSPAMDGGKARIPMLKRKVGP